MVRPELDRVDERAEVVVGEDHAGRLLGHLAAAAHGDADVGLLEGGGVVDGVAGHGDDQALLLHEPGQAQLVLRGDPAEHVQVGQPPGSSSSDIACSSAPLIAPGPEAERLADRLRGDRVVAGDHADVDAGLERDLDGVLRLGPQRVDDADHADERRGPATNDIGSAATAARSASSTSRTANASTRRPFSPIVLRWPPRCRPRASSIGTWDPPDGPPALGAAGEDDVRAALDQLDERARRRPRDPVERRHELVLGVERHLGERAGRSAASPRRRRRAWRRARRARPRSGRRRRRRRRTRSRRCRGTRP